MSSTHLYTLTSRAPAALCTEHARTYRSIIEGQRPPLSTEQRCVFCSPFELGVRVGCTYRDPPALQPWLHQAHRGATISFDDPRAWSDTLAFPSRTPSQREVQEHLAGLALRGIFLGQKSVPVAWDFGRVFWDSTEALYKVEAA